MSCVLIDVWLAFRKTIIQWWMKKEDTSEFQTPEKNLLWLHLLKQKMAMKKVHIITCTKPEQRNTEHESGEHIFTQYFNKRNGYETIWNSIFLKTSKCNIIYSEQMLVICFSSEEGFLVS